MSALISDSLNYKNIGTSIHPTYQYILQTPQETLGSFNVTPTQGPQTTFQLIPNVMLLPKSSLDFTVYVPAMGAGLFPWLNTNGPKMINQITV